MDRNTPQRDEAGAADAVLHADLAQVADWYRAMPVPRPSAEATARLVARLLAEEPAASLRMPRRRRVAGALRIARWRVRLLGAQFWVASVGLLVLGAAWSQSLHTTNGAAPLILLAPLTAVLGMAHALRTSSGGLRAVEASCPTGFVEATSGLALAIVGFDCVLGALATALLALAHWAPFGLLLAAWLGPLLLLAGISLPVAMRWGPLPAAVVGGGPWLLLAAAAGLKPVGLFALPQGNLSLGLHLAAAGVGAMLLVALMVGNPTWLLRVPEPAPR